MLSGGLIGKSQSLLSFPMHKLKAQVSFNDGFDDTVPEHIAVLMHYWTVAVDQEGTVHSKRDPSQ